MLSLMLDLSRFKTFCLVSSLIGCEQDKAIVEEYDRRSLFPMLFKCHYHLHPFAKSKRGVIDQRVEMDNSLDMFKMTTNTNELTMKIINRKLLIFTHYQVNVKDITCPL
jgi:hypothetical protein